MLFIHNIRSVAKYESKVLVRSWFFKVFATLAILMVLFFNIGTLTGGGAWEFVSIPSNFAAFNLLLLNMGQAIIAIFLSSEFLKRDKKLDTSEVFYVRPLSNAEYVFGKIWGNLRVFLSLNFIVIGMVLVFNYVTPGATIDWLSYIYYFLIISVPTLVYIIGLSIFLMLTLNNQAVTFVLLLGYIGLTVFYIGDKFYFLLDYMGYSIPLLKSLIVGFSNLEALIVHRLLYLFLGLGFILYSIKLFRRLPNSPTSVRPWIVLSYVAFGLGLFFVYSHLEASIGTTHSKKVYTELNNKYVHSPKIVVSDYGIELTQNRHTIDATVKMTGSALASSNEFIFCLNPGLKVISVKSGGADLKFRREKQIIAVDFGRQMTEGEPVSLEITYSGRIDESICYLDIPKEIFFEQKKSSMMNIDKNYFFQTGDFLMLTPETYWYPRPGTAFSSTSLDWQQTYFSNFTIKVKPIEGLVAISHGESSVNEGVYTFSPDFPMQAVSVVAGRYENKSVDVDSVKYSVWYIKGHDYFSPVFDSIYDTIPSMIRETRERIERTYRLEYPFERFSIVETPVQFTSYSRTWTQSQEVQQPELMFFPEMGFGNGMFDFRRRQKVEADRAKQNGQELMAKEVQMRMLNGILFMFNRSSGGSGFAGGPQAAPGTTVANPYFIFPQLYNFRYNIYSPDWTVANRLIEVYLQNTSSGGGGGFGSRMRSVTGITNEEKVNLLIKDRSFIELMSDPENRPIMDNLVAMSANRLFAYAELGFGIDRFRDTVFTILKTHSFDNIKFESLIDTLGNIASTDIRGYLSEWETPVKLSAYEIGKPSMSFITTREGEEIYQMEVTVSNISDYPGIIRMEIPGTRNQSSYGAAAAPSRWLVKLEPHQAKTVTTHWYEAPRALTINTMMSANLPSVMSQELTNIINEGPWALRDPQERILRRDPFNVQGEIIVDNEDSTLFRLSDPAPSGYLTKWFAMAADSSFKYSGVGTGSMTPPFQWTAVTDVRNYGKYIHSAYIIKSGNGNQFAEWKVPIKEYGKYDFYYYVRKPDELRQGMGGRGGGGQMGNRGGGGQGGGQRGGGGGGAQGGQRQGQQNQQGQQGQNNRSANEYHFKIFYDGIEEDAYIDLRRSDEGWARVGFSTYHINSDTVRIMLYDKTGLKSVTADAVKLVKRK